MSKLLACFFLFDLWICFLTNCKLTSDRRCNEGDLICRSKYYLHLIKKGEYEKFRELYKLKKNLCYGDSLFLLKLHTLQRENDCPKLEYDIVGDTKADFREVDISAYFNGSLRKTEIISFYFTDNAHIGIPFMFWSRGIIPNNPTKSDESERLRLLERFNELDSLE